MKFSGEPIPTGRVFHPECRKSSFERVDVAGMKTTSESLRARQLAAK